MHIYTMQRPRCFFRSLRLLLQLPRKSNNQCANFREHKIQEQNCWRPFHSMKAPMDTSTRPSDLTCFVRIILLYFFSIPQRWSSSIRHIWTIQGSLNAPLYNMVKLKQYHIMTPARSRLQLQLTHDDGIVLCQRRFQRYTRRGTWALRSTLLTSRVYWNKRHGAGLFGGRWNAQSGRKHWTVLSHYWSEMKVEWPLALIKGNA